MVVLSTWLRNSLQEIHMLMNKVSTKWIQICHLQLQAPLSVPITPIRLVLPHWTAGLQGIYYLITIWMQLAPEGRRSAICGIFDVNMHPYFWEFDLTTCPHGGDNWYMSMKTNASCQCVCRSNSLSCSNHMVMFLSQPRVIGWHVTSISCPTLSHLTNNCRNKYKCSTYDPPLGLNIDRYITRICTIYSV